MFDVLNSSYKKIITSIGIIGYEEEDILKCNSNDYNKLQLHCLYAYPSKNDSTYNSLTYDMMFPNGNRNVETPKFFTLSLTNERGGHSFLYCLKFLEKYKFIKEGNKLNKNLGKIYERKKTKSEQINFNPKYKEIHIPMVICIQSEKHDMEPFRQLLYVIYQIIINDNIDYDKNVINDYKKIELINLFYFLFSLPHTSPHTNISLKLYYSRFMNNNNLAENDIDLDLIDFYFSSNCEIPCNKIDTNIDLLFKILDQTIIIKVLFAILTEKQIILRASEAYLLHIIVPTFLKLIFPFTWIQTSITILPKESLDYLDLPGTYIIGILSSTISIQELLKEYPGKIIVDCDTNEIIGEEITTAFYPSNPKKCDNLNKSSKKKEDKDSINAQNNFGIIQGRNNFIIDGCYLYEYDQNFNNLNIRNRKKLKINSKNNIIIDVQNSQLLTYKNDSYLNSEEWKWLRRNIQMVRNPEIFDIGNIKKRKSSVINVFFDNSKICPIIGERPFSYNIQNIFMTFFLNKLNYQESDFMTYFKTSNLYLNYMEPKKYQNNSGKFIVENINETRTNQRSCNNCFAIEYNLRPFNVNFFLEELDKKMFKIENENNINNNNNIGNKNNNPDYNLYKNIKKALMAYCVVLGMSIKQMNEAINFEILKKNTYKRTSINKSIINNIISNNKLNYFSFNNTNNIIKEHIKNKRSAYNFNIGDDLDSEDENEEENLFAFYGENGFLNFIKNFEKYLKEENLDIKNILYQNAINEQILNDLKQILKQKKKDSTEINIDILDDKFQDNNNSNTEDDDNFSFNLNNISKSKTINHKVSTDLLEEIKSKNSSKGQDMDKARMSVVEEKKDEDESFLDGFISKKATKRLKVNNIEYDLENVFNNFGSTVINEEDDFFFKNIKSTSLGNIPQIGSIITFPDFEKDAMMELIESQNNSNINAEEKIDLKSHYYLFIIYHLEEISKVDTMKNKIIEEIKKTFNVTINLDKLIIKLYKLAFDRSGKKHRDFPYFNFYEYLEGLSFDNLKLLEDNIDKFQLELYDIYNNVIKEKKKIIEKQKQKLGLKDFNLTPTLTSRSVSIGGLEKNNPFKNTLTISKHRESLGIYLNNNNKNNINDNTLKKKLDKKEEKKINKKEDSSKPNFAKKCVINEEKEFEPFCEPGSTHILHELCVLILSCLPNKDDIKNKTINEILEETNVKLKSQTFKELVGELRILDLKQLTSQKAKICFWLNCFNFLLLYTIFYKKWNISGEKNWKNFLNNVKYNIGGYLLSFNDIQYILFNKVYFFPTSYKASDTIKNNLIINKLKSENNNNPFSLYIPTKEFFKPMIYEENTIDNDLYKRKINYLFSFLKVDNKKINITELLLNYEPNFFNSKVVTKYKNIINKTIYEIIVQKKYSDISSRSLKWEMNFDFLNEDVEQFEELKEF